MWHFLHKKAMTDPRRRKLSKSEQKQEPESQKEPEPESEVDSDFSGWSCDDMIPDLCELTVTTDTLHIRDHVHVRYWIYQATNPTDAGADASDDTSDVHPILVINGGPGIPHNYTLVDKQWACRGRPVVFYDQGGVGGSAIPTGDLPTYLTTLDYLAGQELPMLLSHLQTKLNDGPFHLVSDSFGTNLALYYATRVVADPDTLTQTVASISLASPYPDLAHLYEQIWDPKTGSLGTLPPYFQQRFKTLAQQGQFESEEYQQMAQVVMTQFYYRSGVMPDCAMESFAAVNEEIFVAMEGPADYWEITGTMKGLNLLPDLPFLGENTPTLIVNGGYDILPSIQGDQIHEALPHSSERYFIPHSGHALELDATSDYLNLVADFHDRVEGSSNGSFRPLASAVKPGNIDSSSSSSLWIVVACWTVGVVVASFLLVGVGVWIGKRLETNKKHKYETIV